MLENLSYSFLKPNTLDIKLGTVLATEDASPEKRARMERVAAETTSKETGIRLTGFQVRPIVLFIPAGVPHLISRLGLRYLCGQAHSDHEGIR